MALFGRKKTVNPVEENLGVPIAEPTPVIELPRRSLKEQRDFLLDRVQPLRPFGMQLGDVAGLTLCEDIHSDLDLPLVTTSLVDGYGVRAADLVGATAARPATLFVVDHIGAADAPGAPLVPGAAIEVEAGAMVPEGVDAVVPLADGATEGQEVHLIREARLHENLRLAGSELADGAELVASGVSLTPRSIAAMAEVGYDKVLVRPRPRVVVLAVGENLVAPGQPLTQPHQRYDASSALLAASARLDGATVYSLGVVDGSETALRTAISDQFLRADLFIVAGECDGLDAALDSLGHVDRAEVAVNSVDVYRFVMVNDERVPLITLPVGAVSAYVGYHAFVRPMLGRLNDVDPLGFPQVQARMVEEVDANEGVTEFLPARLEEDGTVRPVSALGRELAYDLGRANVLVVVPETWGGVAVDSTVECIVLDGVHPGVSSLA